MTGSIHGITAILGTTGGTADLITIMTAGPLNTVGMVGIAGTIITWDTILWIIIPGSVITEDTMAQAITGETGPALATAAVQAGILQAEAATAVTTDILPVAVAPVAVTPQAAVILPVPAIG